MSRRIEQTIYRQRWAVCDDCGCSITVTNEDGVRDPESEDTEWDDSWSCPVCGESLAGGFGNADEITEAQQWFERCAELRREIQGLRADLSSSSLSSHPSSGDPHE